MVRPEHRVFTSLLMTDYFDPETRARIEALLAKRTVFSDRAKALIESWRSKGATVDYLPVPGEHLIAAGWAMPSVLRWMRGALGD